MPAATDHDAVLMRLARLEQELAEENETLAANVRELHDRTCRVIRQLRRAVQDGASHIERDKAAEAYEAALRQRKMLSEALGTLQDLRQRIEAST